MTRQAALRLYPDPKESERVHTPRGASATAEGERLVVRDARGAIVVVYDAEAGSATIVAPVGDLRLAAPTGNVVIEAGEDVELSSRRTVRTRAVAVESDADVTRFRSKAFEVVTGVWQTTARTVVHGVGSWSLGAERVLERANDVVRAVQGLMETRAGRVRTVVQDTTQVRSGSTSISSKEDTFIDGRRVLLG